MKLNARAMALSLGIIGGASIFIATAWIVIAGEGGGTLAKLGTFYIGYTVTWGGAFIGLAYGFVDGLVGGYLIAALYNAFLPKQDKS